MNLLRDFLQKYKTGDKVFSDWCIFQKKLNQRKPVGFNEREIRWCSVGVNVGYEIDGKGKMFTRPVLIFKKISNEKFLGIPLTRSTKDFPGYLEYKKDSYLVLEQVRVFDSKRLMGRIETVSKNKFSTIQVSFLNYLSPHKRGPDD